MKLFLVVLFFQGNQPVYEDGWYPTEQPDYETCMIKRQRVEDVLFTIFYNEKNPPKLDGFTVLCQNLPDPESLPLW